MPTTINSSNSESYKKTGVKKGNAASCFLLGVLVIFPLLSQAGSEQNEVERQLRDHIFSLLETWRRTNGIEQLRPRLTLRGGRQMKPLANCQRPVQFTKKSDTLLGIQQWRAGCPATGKSGMIRSQLTVKALLPVAANTLARGHVISDGDIVRRWVKFPKARGRVLTKKAQLVGKRVKHKLRRLTPVPAKQLLADIWVSAGERVIIEAGDEGFSAHTQGEALQSGGEGQAIKVRNLSSGKVIVAYPVARGKVATRF